MSTLKNYFQKLKTDFALKKPAFLYYRLNYTDGPSYLLRRHLPMTFDARDSYMRLSLKYVTADKGLVRETQDNKIPIGITDLI